jgi:hypothetical protein
MVVLVVYVAHLHESRALFIRWDSPIEAARLTQGVSSSHTSDSDIAHPSATLAPSLHMLAELSERQLVRVPDAMGFAQNTRLRGRAHTTRELW